MNNRHKMAAMLLLFFFGGTAVLSACEDDPKPNGEVCEDSEECISAWCETQHDGSRVCDNKPDHSTGPSGW